MNTYLNIAAGHQPQQSTLASSGWFIGMLLAIIFLLGVCLVVCLVKRNRGGKYAVQVLSACVVVVVVIVVVVAVVVLKAVVDNGVVQEQEATHGRPDYDDQGGFSEYTQP